jgi:hypothetical protein
MRLMRHLATRLVTILLYCSSVLVVPAVVLEARPMPRAAKYPVHTCSCPMCRAATPGHHCSCCNGGDTCTCELSSNDQEESLQLAVPKPGLLAPAGNYLVLLQSAPLFIRPPHSVFAPYLPVPTPPPKR